MMMRRKRESGVRARASIFAIHQGSAAAAAAACICNEGVDGELHYNNDKYIFHLSMKG
jgi:hypothetical protein